MKTNDTLNQQQTKPKNWRREVRDWTVALLASFGLVGLAMAQSLPMGSDPLGDGICRFVSFMTGKWLFGSMVVAIAGSGIPLLFGAEMSDMIKKVVTIIFIGGVILMATTILAYVFTKFGGMTC